MQDYNLLKIWKSNVVAAKWLNFKMNDYNFSQHKIDDRIKTLKSFFNQLDLNTEKGLFTNHILQIDPSENWLQFILIQKNLGTIYLVFELCDVIKYFSKRDLFYLKHKLLDSKGRVLKDFSNKYFEVVLNFNFEKSGIPIRLNQCYRSLENPENEGHDTYFKFFDSEYAVECYKIKSNFDKHLDASFQLTQIVNKVLKKNIYLAKFLPINIFLKLSDNPLDFGKEFKKIFKNYLLSLDSTKNIFIHQSENFEKIVFVNYKETINKIFDFKKEYLRLGIEFKDFKYLNKNKKEVGINITEDTQEYRNYRISSELKFSKSNKEIEKYLISKIKNKKRQLEKQLVGNNRVKKVIAIELESYPAFGSSQYNFEYSYPEIKKMSKKDLIIILFFKDSSGTKLIYARKFFHFKNERLVLFLNEGKIF